MQAKHINSDTTKEQENMFFAFSNYEKYKYVSNPFQASVDGQLANNKSPCRN